MKRSVYLQGVGAGLTHIGRVRRANEDSMLLLHQPEDQCVLAVVADGMGGHRGGAIASSLATRQLQAAWDTWWQDNRTMPDVDWLFENVQITDMVLRERAEEDASLCDMGTTVVAILLKMPELLVVYIGDSRAYRYHARDFTRLTHDHTVVQRLVDQGELTLAEAEKSPMRHYLTRSLGGGDTISQPEARMLKVEKGDRILLCSDGLTGMLSDSDIAAVLAVMPDDRKAADLLLDLALSRGASDNVSLVICTA